MFFYNLLLSSTPVDVFYKESLIVANISKDADGSNEDADANGLVRWRAESGVQVDLQRLDR